MRSRSGRGAPKHKPCTGCKVIFVLEMMNICIENDELCTKHDELCTKNDALCMISPCKRRREVAICIKMMDVLKLEMMNSVLEMMIFMVFKCKQPRGEAPFQSGVSAAAAEIYSRGRLRAEPRRETRTRDRDDQGPGARRSFTGELLL